MKKALSRAQNRCSKQYCMFHSTTATIMMSSLLFEVPDIHELVCFLRGTLPRSDLLSRKWIKPEAKFDKLWKWCVTKSLSGRFRSDIIVTRSAIVLRVHAD
jgi:hypothetical protein